ncbi:unnamed protein product [Heligmosomoides polygyrus]|uniref:HTH_48 domain-containing protein n=1 Tax=Heligmosomoides polygyrus TaxID=6339 RepID=A0A3P7Y767_HELPZ|nr:unnamed protein product [Heligmosomoides polygyrus]
MGEKEAAVISRVRLPTVTTVDETWKKATDAIRQAAQSELGITKPGRRKVDKQAWLWTDDVKAKEREKNPLYHVFLGEETPWLFQKATHYGDVNEKLESRDGKRYLYQLSKFGHRQTEDIEKFFNINDENGHLLRALTRGPVQKITVEEIEAALKMRPGKASCSSFGLIHHSLAHLTTESARSLPPKVGMPFTEEFAHDYLRMATNPDCGVDSRNHAARLLGQKILDSISTSIL